VQIGDICKIWNGKSSISESNNWLIGIVIKKKKIMIWSTTSFQFQALWNDDRGFDETWYEENDIRFDK